MTNGFPARYKNGTRGDGIKRERSFVYVNRDPKYEERMLRPAIQQFHHETADDDFEPELRPDQFKYPLTVDERLAADKYVSANMPDSKQTTLTKRWSASEKSETPNFGSWNTSPWKAKLDAMEMQ